MNKFKCEACKKNITYICTKWTQVDIVYGESYIEDSDEQNNYDDGIRDLTVTCPKCDAEIIFDDGIYMDASMWERAVKELIDSDYTGMVCFKSKHEDGDEEYQELKYINGKKASKKEWSDYCNSFRKQ